MMFTPKFRPALWILWLVLVVDFFCLAAYIVMCDVYGPLSW